jgi:hypothetical protein
MCEDFNDKIFKLHKGKFLDENLTHVFNFGNRLKLKK